MSAIDKAFLLLCLDYASLRFTIVFFACTYTCLYYLLCFSHFPEGICKILPAVTKVSDYVKANFFSHARQFVL